MSQVIKDMLESTADYVQLSEEEVLGLFQTDAPIAQARRRIVEQQEKIREYAERDEQHRAAIDKLDDEEMDLLAQIKVLDTQRREIKGLIEGNRYHAKLAERRILQSEMKIAQREKKVVQHELEKRLKTIGRELKQNVGLRAIRRGYPGGHSVEPIL